MTLLPRFFPRPLNAVILFALASLFLSACAAPPPANIAGLTFAHKGQFSISAGELVIAQDYIPPATDPHVDHLFTLSPTFAAMQWARDRLQTTGGTNRLIYRIVDASVTAEKIKIDKGTLKQLIHQDATDAYTGTIRVTLSLENARGETLATVEAHATRKTTALPELNLRERDELWFAMTEKLMSEIDRQLSQSLPSYFEKYLINT